MKKIFLYFSILLISCNSNKIELESIEIMGYIYLPNLMSNNYEGGAFIYASIDSLGRSKNLQKQYSAKVIGYSNMVDRNLIREIIIHSYSKDENYFTIKPSTDTTSTGIVCGDNRKILIKISYTNGKVISFFLDDKNYDKTSKYYLYKTLYDDILKSPITATYNSTDLKNLKIEQKKFLKYAINKDTLFLPVPPPAPRAPNLDEVKFIKPK